MHHPTWRREHFVICPVRDEPGGLLAHEPHDSPQAESFCLLAGPRKLLLRAIPHTQAVSYTHTRLLQRSSAVGKSPAAWSPQALCALLLIPAAACRLPRR